MLFNGSGHESTEWLHLVQCRVNLRALMNTANERKVSVNGGGGGGNFLTIQATIGFS